MSRLFPDSVYKPRKGETKDDMETRLWKPVRKGAIYCAPRCGCGCSWADYQRAVKQAAALCKLLGPGWEPRIWENGGWNYEVHKGLARVYADHFAETEVHYSVWLETEVGSIGGNIKAMMQVIVDVPRKRDGTSDIKATLKKALKMKRQAAMQLIAEADAVEA